MGSWCRSGVRKVWEAVESCSRTTLHLQQQQQKGDGGGGGGQEPVYEPISLDHTETILWEHALIPLIPPVWVCMFDFYVYVSV